MTYGDVDIYDDNHDSSEGNCNFCTNPYEASCECGGLACCNHTATCDECGEKYCQTCVVDGVCFVCKETE